MPQFIVSGPLVKAFQKRSCLWRYVRSLMVFAGKCPNALDSIEFEYRNEFDLAVPQTPQEPHWSESTDLPRTNPRKNAFPQQAFIRVRILRRCPAMPYAKDHFPKPNLVSVHFSSDARIRSTASSRFFIEVA